MTLSEADVEASVISQLKDIVNDDAVLLASDTPLISLNLLDSMDLLSIVAWAETTYRISVDPDSLVPENFETPADIARLISAFLHAEG